jgi:spore germination protein
VPSTTAASAPPPLPLPKLSAWLPYWDDGTGLATFRSHANRFTSIHPFWYEASSAVEVKKQGKPGDLIDIARANSVGVIPTVTETMKPAPFASLLADTARRADHVRTLCNIALDNGYDGLDINYEQFAVTPAKQTFRLLPRDSPQCSAS